MNKRFLGVLSLSLVSSLCMMSCGGNQETSTNKEEPVVSTVKTEKTVEKDGEVLQPIDKGTVFKIANMADPASLDPAFIQGVPGYRVNLSLFEGLVGINPETAEPIPGLAESWDVSEDKTVWTFHLRQAQWSDGSPITAHDVVYSWLRELDPETASPYAWFPCQFIQGATDYNNGDAASDTVKIKALDDHTFQVVLVGPIPFFLEALQHFAFNIVPKQAIEQWGSDWTQTEHFVGNGPFVLTKRVPQSLIEVVPNKYYWDKENVNLDKIIYLSSADANTNYNMYVNGEVDWDTTAPTDQLSAISMRDDFHKHSLLGVYYYVFNTQRVPFDNENIRKALSLAVDRDALVDGVTKGGELPAYGMVPAMENYEAIQSPFEDHADAVAEAQELLADAGYPDGQGLPEITILYNTSDNHKAIAEFIQQEWKKNLGITAILQNEEWSTYLNDRSTHNFDVARAGWVGVYQDPSTFLDMFISTSAENDGQYVNEQFDTLEKGANLLPSGLDRLGVLRTAESLLIQSDQAVMPLYNYVSLNLIDTEKWGGWFPNTMDYHPLKTIYKK